MQERIERGKIWVIRHLPALVEHLPDSIRKKFPDHLAFGALTFAHFLDRAYFAPRITIVPVYYYSRDRDHKRREFGYGIRFEASDSERVTYYLKLLGKVKEKKLSDEDRIKYEEMTYAAGAKRLLETMEKLGGTPDRFKLIVGDEEKGPDQIKELSLQPSW